MHICHFQPNIILEPYIDRYWSWESYDQNNFNLPCLVPGTGAELVFHYGDPLIYSCKNYPDIKTPRCHIICLRHTPHDLKPSGRIGFISVRFRAGMLRHFCKIPLVEIIDTFQDIKNIWGKYGTEISDKVLAAKNTNNRIDIIESELMKLLQIYKKDENAINYAVHRIYYGHKGIIINEIAEELNMSRRHFQRIFSGAIGSSPKSFHRNARFQQTLKSLILNHKSNYLPEALENGFFDQSHFIKDFKYFTNTTPSIFLEKNKLMSHFYNTTL